MPQQLQPMSPSTVSHGVHHRLRFSNLESELPPSACKESRRHTDWAPGRVEYCVGESSRQLRLPAYSRAARKPSSSPRNHTPKRLLLRLLRATSRRQRHMRRNTGSQLSTSRIKVGVRGDRLEVCLTGPQMSLTTPQSTQYTLGSLMDYTTNGP